jgi:hypothetical protein
MLSGYFDFVARTVELELLATLIACWFRNNLMFADLEVI